MPITKFAVAFGLLLLGLGTAAADSCRVAGHPYLLDDDRVDWTIEVQRYHSCAIGVRLGRVLLRGMKLLDSPQAGKLTLQGLGFTYAAADAVGQDSFTVEVTGEIVRRPGRSVIEVTVSIVDAPVPNSRSIR
jgi:hypothetical protein